MATKEQVENQEVDSLYDFLQAPPKEKEIEVPQFPGKKFRISRMTKSESDKSIFSKLSIKDGSLSDSFMPQIVIDHLIFPNLKSAEFLTKRKYATPEDALNDIFLIDTIELIYSEIRNFSNVGESISEAVSKVKNS